MFFRFNLGVSATILLYAVAVLVAHYSGESAAPSVKPYDRVIERSTISPLEKELGEPIVPADSIRKASSGGW